MQSEGYLDLFASRTITLMIVIKADVHPRPQLSVLCLVLSHAEPVLYRSLVL